jgi:MYXO-CTERM domain-containing protein
MSKTKANARWMTLGLLLCLHGTAHAAPAYPRLSYVGDTSTTMTITWNTTASEDSTVRFGVQPGVLGETVTGTTLQANDGLGYVHEVTLTGLVPSTRYFYVAGSTAGGFTAETSFTTGPAQDQDCGRFRFVFLGDNRPDPTFGGGENWPQILDQSIQHDPAFVLNGGDLVIDGDQIDQWHAFLGWTTTAASARPFMPVMGNHDDGPGDGDGANYNQLFALPRSTGPHGSNTEDYYFFTFGNAIFVSLSTEGFKEGTVAFGNQAAWLDQVLTENPRRWKFVSFHKPAYTHEAFFSISHEPNEEGQNAAWVPVIDRHHVDVVFTSHNHWYERYEPSACGTSGRGGSSEPCPTGGFATGTVYYVSGGAGAFTIPGFLCGNQSGRAVCSGDHHYILATIHDDTATLETWSAYPQANQVMDSITITKGAGLCPEGRDAGTARDAAVPDGAQPDASVPDAATVRDASRPDSAPPWDAGGTDASVTVADAGAVSPPEDPAGSRGCGCASSSEASAAWIGLLALLASMGLHRRRFLAVFVLIALASGYHGCVENPPEGDSPDACQQVQHRAEQCQEEALSLVRTRLAGESVSPQQATQQFAMFETRFRSRLQAKTTQAQCEKFRQAQEPGQRRRFQQVVTCLAKDDCTGFSTCMMEL